MITPEQVTAKLIKAMGSRTYTSISQALHMTPAGVRGRMERETMRLTDILQVADVLGYDVDVVLTDRQTGDKL